ncbi:hypothetical protein GLX27_002523 [Malassezia furfur]|uniref:WHI2-like protein P4H10.16c n=1 Tax=Malassezia furfur TaxID=55194 RepID=A0ABY8EQL2_MALFU|nr:hypothetical protein GLX27_002523 [Malassezia furfur]
MDASAPQEADGPPPFARLILDLRGVYFVIERETLMSLPESILLCLFPNGLVLPEGNPDETGDTTMQDEHVYHVDFDANCLQYVLSFFRRAQEYFYGTDKAPGVYRGMGRGANILDFADPMQGAGGFGNHFYLPLFHKQAIIVLREELEYFTIAPKGMARSAVARPPVGNRPPQASEEFAHLKDACGDVLLQRRQIFTALQRNINKENNVAEQHLIDMLCMSGFEQDDLWGYRAREANRCSITSTAMVLLKTGVTHRGELPEGRAPHQPAPRKPIGVERTGVDPDAGLEPLDTHVSEEQLGEWVDDAQGGSLRVNQHQLNTTQKLLLFWRKPARKCWWDGIDLVVPSDGIATKPQPAPSSATLGTLSRQERAWLEQGKGLLVRVWVRRIWTLEVSLI